MAPGTEETFTVNLVADASAVGQMLGGTLLVETSYGSKDSQYASMLDGLIERDFAVPFQGMASESGESNLCKTGVLGDDGATRATFVIDRVTMVMTDLIESAHNPPPFRFHLPLEVNRDQGTVRIAEPIELQFNEADLDYRKSIRSYTHQATNIQGCAPLPTNPYRLEFEKGSSRQSLGLSGEEAFDIKGIASGLSLGKKLEVSAKQSQNRKTFQVICRIDTPAELLYYQHGGILQYVLRQLVQKKKGQ